MFLGHRAFVDGHKFQMPCGHPASRALSFSLIQERALHESCQIFVEHAQSLRETCANLREALPGSKKCSGFISFYQNAFFF